MKAEGTAGVSGGGHSFKWFRSWGQVIELFVASGGGSDQMLK
jgi:hypothetical protein